MSPYGAHIFKVAVMMWLVVYCERERGKVLHARAWGEEEMHETVSSWHQLLYGKVNQAKAYACLQPNSDTAGLVKPKPAVDLLRCREALQVLPYARGDDRISGFKKKKDLGKKTGIHWEKYKYLGNMFIQ